MDDNKAEPNALIAQLTQLNERGRHYAAQIWQVPFAYLGLVLLALGQSWDAGQIARGSISTSMAVVGVMVVVHYFGLLERNEAVVNAIADVERKMDLSVVTSTNCLITCPLVVMLIAIIVGLPFAGWLL